MNHPQYMHAGTTVVHGVASIAVSIVSTTHHPSLSVSRAISPVSLSLHITCTIHSMRSTSVTNI